MSRDEILAAVKANQPPQQALPNLDMFTGNVPGDPAAFRRLVETLGGQVFEITDVSEIQPVIQQHFADAMQVVATDPAWYTGALTDWQTGDGRQLEQVDVAIIRAQLGVAENGAVWVTEKELQVRVLPFITQHLAIVLSRVDIVATMHDAYARIGGPDSGFGVFIAGPSKTADIEQSLVLGAHGAKSLTVFMLNV